MKQLLLFILSFKKIEHRQEGKVGAVFYPAPGLNDKTIEFYESAYDIDMRKVIDVYAAHNIMLIKVCL